MKKTKFDVLVEEVTSRYQQGGLLMGDYVIIRKDALKNEKLKDRPSNFFEMLKTAMESGLPIRVSAIKSERPETSNDLIGGANNAPTGFWVDICVEYAPGLWKSPMTLPLEVLEIANPENGNYPSWPDSVKRKDNTTKMEEPNPKATEENIKQTQGNKRNLPQKDTKIPTGKTVDGRESTKVKESLSEIYESITQEV